MSTIQNQEYSNWIVSLKSSIKQRQIKAAIAVNSNLILMYWDLGKQIVDRQENAKWGSGFNEQVSKDLKSEFPDIGGFSSYNLRFCKTFFEFYNSQLIWEQTVPKSKNTIVQQVGGQFEEVFLKCFQIAWRQNITIIEKIKNPKEVN
jgi:hypothetical protein